MVIKRLRLRYTKEEAIKVVKILRFRNKDPRKCKLTFMSLKDIAKHFGKSISYVANICEKIKRESD